ncbi:MAG: hypothetical protein JWM68_697 [Verrucomicrobiales bacterium]|nr:hypothetical protein [Verrucomicrobiales bacterium]
MGPVNSVVLSISVIAVLTIIGLVAWLSRGAPDAATLRQLASDPRFSAQQITETFISAIPTLTQEMNLEVASSKQTEVFERTDARCFIGIDLGTNTVQLKVPTTYRFFICLYDPWKLHVNGNSIVVSAPPIRCSKPPAIHTDEIQESISRGWARSSPQPMLEKMRHDLTPRLCEFAEDPRRMDLVREKCRQSVAEFVKRWLEGESRWQKGKFTSIRVHFVNEPVVAAKPTIQLLDF